MPADAYRALLAATNMKQRVRKLLEYTWADRLSLRGDRHAEPARVRPGVLRQGRRRARRRQADRRASTRAQVYALARELGLPGGDRDAPRRRRRRSRCRRRRRSSTSATRTSGWTCWCGDSDNDVAPARPGAARVGLEAERGRGRLPGDRATCASRRRTCTPRRSWSSPPSLTCAGSPASSAPHGRRRWTKQALLRMARAIRHRGPDGFGLALEAGAGLVSHAAGDLRPAVRLAADATGADGDAARLQRRGLQPPGAARELARAGSAFETDQRHRGRAARCSSARGSPRSTASTASSRSRWWEPGAAPADARARPLRRAPAALRAAATTAASCSARRRRRCSPPARCAPRPTSRASTTSSRSGAPRAPRTAFRGVAQLPPGGLLVWERGRIVERAAGGGPPEYRARRREPADGAATTCCATACACGCARTCRSAPTSPAGWTRA